MKRVSMIISGRVQGVCFRAATLRKANELGVSGWVRNIQGGQVEILVEGKEEDVEGLVSWCYDGPPLARVVDIKTNVESYRGDFLSFSIT